MSEEGIVVARMHDLATLVCWDGQSGKARFQGVSVILDAAPSICPHVVEVDYVPALRRRHVRQSAGVWREMKQSECDRLDALLARTAAAARGAWRNWEA